MAKPKLKVKLSGIFLINGFNFFYYAHFFFLFLFNFIGINIIFSQKCFSNVPLNKKQKSNLQFDWGNLLLFTDWAVVGNSRPSIVQSVITKLMWNLSEKCLQQTKSRNKKIGQIQFTINSNAIFDVFQKPQNIFYQINKIENWALAKKLLLLKTSALN